MAGTWRQELRKRLWRHDPTDWLHMPCSAGFLKTQDHQLRGDITYSVLTLPHQLVNKEMLSTVTLQYRVYMLAYSSFF